MKLVMKNAPQREEPEVLSYLALRKVVGYLGLALPLVVVWFASYTKPVQESLSAYYYTPSRNIFVGILCAIGVFMLCNRGYKPADRRKFSPDVWLANIGCFTAVGTACFPTAPKGADWLQTQLSRAHFTCAATFFVVLALSSIFIFRRSAEDTEFTERKKTRNRVYFGCGVAILFCVVVIFYAKALAPAPFEEWWNAKHLTLVFEWIAVWAFGYSWLTKGEAIWADKHPSREKAEPATQRG
jgi:multisubunit Na+/H+ antiporter MnhB subunit